MKQLRFLAFVFILGLAACQPDSSDDPSPDTTASINFVGSWNRDSVLINNVFPSKLKVRVETESNYGVYIFNSDLESGVLNLTGSDFAITWKYTESNKSILINEVDWMGMTYAVTELSKTKLILTGYKDAEEDNQIERIIYLTKK
jgi:hypothetical protein